MNAATPFLHLLWKEYRAARTFWLALVGMVILAQLLTLALSQEQKTTLAIVYGFALAAPVLFALGSAGASFAIEKEEGTFDFLQAIPVTARQLVTSKLLLTVLATLAMYLLLWPIALAFTHGTLPETATLTGMLGLWCVAALEAIAWATFFSLLITRPLVAICLAVAAASTIAHFVASGAKSNPNNPFELLAFLRTVPIRLGIVALVLAADAVIALRWLHPSSKAASRGPKDIGTRATGAQATIRVGDPAVAQFLSNRPDRGAILGHLFWQHWRQSKWLMLGTVVLGPIVSAMIAGIVLTWMPENVYRPSNTGHLVWVAILATLAGAFVFLPDQERRRYRFFAEHNVPPRAVWLTRQIAWMSLLTLASAVGFACWLWNSGFASAWRFLQFGSSWSYMALQYGHVPPVYFVLPPIGATLAWIFISYAAGQWASMHIRSAVMAAFCGLMISAVLCACVALVTEMEISWVWSIAPIPLVLLLATWLRAPHWIAENKTWRARLRATGVVLLPAVVLLIAVPIYRVHQVPLVEPGFDPAAFESQIPRDGLETADMYRKAAGMLVVLEETQEDGSTLELDPQAHAAVFQSLANRDWLAENAATLKLVLEASKLPHCVFTDPKAHNYTPPLPHLDQLIWLVGASAWQLEAEGKLDEALERHLLAIRAASQLAEVGGAYRIPPLLNELTVWAGQKGQSSAQIRTAIKRLEEMDSSILRLDERLKSDYLIVTSAVRDNEPENAIPYGPLDDSQQVRGDIVWNALMPWERYRGVRVANLIVQIGLDRLQKMRDDLAASDPKGVVTFVSPGRLSLEYDYSASGRYFYASNRSSVYEYFSLEYVFPRWLFGWSLSFSDEKLDQRVAWLRTTRAWLSGLGQQGTNAASLLARFEATRRATMTILAIDAYRLESGMLPSSLDELVGKYLDAIQRDPYSGRYFQYLPHGVPAPTRDEATKRGVPPQPLTVPNVWCSGPNLAAYRVSDLAPESTKRSPLASDYVTRNDPFQRETLSIEEAYPRGLWYPIPPQQQ